MNESPAESSGQTRIEQRNADDEALLRFVAEHRVNCPRCDQSLANLRDCRCPACGQQLVLSLGAVDFVGRAWIVMMSSILAAAGMGIFTLIICSKEGWPRDVNGKALFLQIALAYFVANIPLAAIVLRRRRRFMRLSTCMQRNMAIIIALLTLGAFVLLFSQMRR